MDHLSIFYLTTFFVIFFNLACNSCKKDDDLAKIEQLHQTDMKAAKEGDIATLSSLMSDDFTLIALNAEPIIGKEANVKILDQQLKLQENYKVIEYIHDFKEVKIIDDWAYEWGTYRGTTVPIAGGEPIKESGKLMRILKKQSDGSWKITRAIWNVDTKQHDKQ